VGDSRRRRVTALSPRRTDRQPERRGAPAFRSTLTAGVHMRRLYLAVLAMAPVVVSAQGTPVSQRQALPRDVRREVVDRWNNASSAALRATTRVVVDTGREVRGDVIVLTGPVIIAGHVNGNVLAINADVELRSSAHVDGDVLVVGGDITG